MLRQMPNRRHRSLAPANSDLESSDESRPGYHPVEVHTQAGPTQVSLHNQAVEALVETKNGAVIRKHMGYGYLHAEHAEPLQHFYSTHLNPYLNYHRPCAQADIQVDEKGRQRRHYRRYQTPLET